MRWLGLLLPVACSLVALASCDTGRDPPVASARPAPTTTDGFDAGLTDGPPPLDAPGLCGNELHETGYDPPNVYFVIDRSASMAASNTPDGPTRYAELRTAVLDLVRRLGPLIEVGAALFPRTSQSADPCHTGGEVFALRQGDPVTGVDGPTTLGLRYATGVDPYGGTPMAATLVALEPILTGFSGKTIVVITTDGAPNCNASAECGPEECIAYIEGACGDDETCCDPNGPAGPISCMDRLPTLEAVTTLANAGLEVYIVGIPGSSEYADLLDDLAVAGGTARAGEPLYQRVDDLADLGDVLAAIAADAIPCEFVLVDPPEGLDMTNVYLDASVVPYDPTDGWTWLGTDTIVLHGQACETLKTGGATSVQIVTGCPTELPK